MSAVSLLNSGDKFNSWTFLNYCEERKGYGVFRCVCGEEKEVHINNVVKNKSKGCGCLWRKRNSEKCRKDFDIGDVRGFLTVIGESVKPEGKKNRYTPCRCICGKEVLAANNKLRDGRKDSCGCKTNDKFRAKKNRKITPGEKYNRLTVLREVDPVIKENGHRKRQLECQCDCGNIKVIEMTEVTCGGTKSCGCIREDNVYKTHGMSDTSVYHTWAGIIARCENPNDGAYKYYGGRGIRMCERWRNSFECFLEDMGEKPAGDYSIERIDYNKNYEPGNCKWATRIEQARNKSNNRLIKYAGKTKTFAEWVEMFDVNYKSFWGKCNRANWEIEEIFNEAIGF